jgi:hypothetical protein
VTSVRNENDGPMRWGVFDFARSMLAGIGATGDVMNGVEEVRHMAGYQYQAVAIGGVDMRDMGMKNAPVIAASAEEQVDGSCPGQCRLRCLRQGW